MSMMNPYAKYQENQVLTASPGKLLILTYDIAIKAGHSARQGMKGDDLHKQNEGIKKMLNVLIRLSHTLNREVYQKLTSNLEAIYNYCFSRLTHANINDDLSALDEVMKIHQLRTTWVEADLIANGGRQQGDKAA